MQPLIIAGAGLFGLLVGSFLNVVILRLPARLEHEWRCQCRELLEHELAEQPELSAPPPDLVMSRSACPKCGKQLAWYDNVPLLSWLALRGRCRACQAPISPQYPLVEAATGILFAMLAWRFGASLEALLALAFAAFLVALTGIDLRKQLLPDVLVYPLLWLGLLANAAGLFTDLGSAVIGAAAGYLSLWLVYHAFRLLTGKEGMGYGDFKLLAALGAWMGWQMLPLIILLSSLVGAIVGITLVLFRGQDRNIPIPFGPYLAAAGLLALLAGDTLIRAYLGVSGL